MTLRSSAKLVTLLAGAAACTAGVAWNRAAGDSAPASAAQTGPNKTWSQWGGSPSRNNTPVGVNIPTEWEVGEFDVRTDAWDKSNVKNVKWAASLGSRSYGSVVVHNGKVMIGTNNGTAHLDRYPKSVDLGCLLCFDAKDGKFLWQHSSTKLPSGRVHDWPHEGNCSVPYCEGDRLWFVTNRCEVRCLDVEGFLDGENDGNYKTEEAEVKAQATASTPPLPYDMKQEADVIWVVDMMSELGVSPHNMSTCSITAAGDVLFICTSNGIDEEHKFVPAPDAPSFMAMDKNTGKVLWTDNSPGKNIHHGQWSSPAYGVLGGQAQVIFGGGDGWVYSFDPKGDGAGKSKLLWKFDCNPKEAKLELGGYGTRNDCVATPVIYDGLVYMSTGQDPEHKDGIYPACGDLWCIDPTKRGDVSPELAFNGADPNKPIPYKRVQAVVKSEGDFARPNPNSAVVWHYREFDKDGDGAVGLDNPAEYMHRCIGTVAIKDDVLYIMDISGIVHCMNAKTGDVHWTYDTMSEAWGTPLIVDNKVYVGDSDGYVSIFKHSADPKVAMKDEGGEMEPFYGRPNMGGSVYATPVVADNVLYISDAYHLFAIAPDAE